MSDLGDRMKLYEDMNRQTIMPRMPAIIRVDGRAFHSLLRGCKKPFDEDVVSAMNEAALALVREISTARFAYVQSDEISVLLVDYDTFFTQQWFGGTISKIVSISASIATAAFTKAYGKIGHFDSRVWSIHQDEVCNYFIWRQKDWERNSIQMVARSLYSQKQLHGKKVADLHELIHEKGLNWNDVPTHLKRGRIVTRQGVDNEMPILTADREYVEKHLLKLSLDTIPANP